MNYLKLFEEFGSNDIEVIEDYFLELMDHRTSEIPINVDVANHNINLLQKGSGKKIKVPGYKITILFDYMDQLFVKKIVTTALIRLLRDYKLHYNQISKMGHGYNYKEVPVYGTNRTSTVQDPIWKQTITISKKIVNESFQQPQTNLIIVDCQPSFRKFFTEMYVHDLKKYAKTFTYVYQIWDNHHEGRNVDKDYLYDNNPDVPVNNDLYNFPNQKEMIEKRYNYDVDVDFYKKILDEKTYKDAKHKEGNGLLVRGNYFLTTEGTIIVYVGNNHNFFHISKKMYNLFTKLKGKEVVMVGGSNSECFADIETAAISLGVLVKRNDNFIYSATFCPIK